ncbi:MAG: hypothetical protein H7Z42_20095 [Roseiflexaceae bacterium]|nr:hypothetical protein [Roseiflexaceae bacterium]
MQLTLLPTLAVQRELHGIPRGPERFRAYLVAMTKNDEIALPLAGMNPMGREHVAAMLDGLLETDAEAQVAAAAASAAAELGRVSGAFQVALVATDDLMGGWTNRYFAQISTSFPLRKSLEYGWITVPIWTSEQWTAARVYAHTRAAIYRAAHYIRFGEATRLDQMLLQEGRAMRFAALAPPPLDAEDVAYSRAVLRPLHSATDYGTIVAGLFGDQAARSVGYPPLGLSANAGFAVAYSDASDEARSPADVL